MSRQNYLAHLLALTMIGGGRFADSLPRTEPKEPPVVDEVARQRAIEKRRASDNVRE